MENTIPGIMELLQKNSSEVNNVIRRMTGDTYGSNNYISGINMYPGGSLNRVKIWNNII